MHKDGHWEWKRGREQHCPFKRCQNALAMIGLQGRETKKEVIITISVGMYPRQEGASSVFAHREVGGSI